MKRLAYFACAALRTPLLLSLLSFCPGEFAPLGASEREHFVRELSRNLLLADGPVETEYGWRGVLLVPPGTSLSAFVTNYEALGSRLANNTQILADSYLFDRPLAVRNGVAFPKARRLSEVWEQILRHAIPRAGLSQDDFIEQEPETAKWLFRLPDRVDRIRGTAPVREPSEFYLRYREYQLLHRLILAGESAIASSADSWRLHPRLAKYDTAEQAKESVEADWQKYGYRQQVESAQRDFDRRAGAHDWRNWMLATEALESNLVAVDRSLRIPRTSLSPPPSEWLRMGGWQRSRATTERDGAPIGFEIARIKVVREWFRVEDLLRGDIRIESPEVPNGVLLSDGKAPTLVTYPEGPMSVYVDELIVARNIRYDPAVSTSGHPLTDFALPLEIQVIGYVVHALPGR
ncbi:MAG: hypothetical protein JNM18_23485 [Planctomycetaceae bacterium]|nr:hypothetical protein [Planctomycetaceae bacterium]